MEQQIPLSNQAVALNPEQDSARDDATHQIAPDLAYRRLAIANVIFYGLPNAGDRQWVLIDAGVMGMTGLIVSAAAQRFGENARPAAIVMTHGHFDHVGALEDLAERWDAPVYAHPLEMPYLNGSAAYTPPDPGVGGGMMALLSPLYPRGPVNVGHRLHALPEDGTVPFMPDWQWTHTPGHTPGHISLWRETDKAIVAGDAFITTAQESAYAVATQRPEMHGPPMYFTPNWQEARASVQRLAALQPQLVITGHGPAMHGPEVSSALLQLAQNFDAVAVPEHGKYVHNPVTAQSGTAYVPIDKS